MDFRHHAADEFRRQPVATVCTVIATSVGVISLLVAVAFQGSASIANGSPSSLGGAPTNSLEMAPLNVVWIIGYFLSVTVAGALIVRRIEDGVTAYLASIMTAAITSFSTILFVYLVPPIARTPQLFSEAHSVVTNASLFVFATFFGRSFVGHILATDDRRTAAADAPKSSGDGWAPVVGLVVSVWAWHWLVSTGQEKLTRSLLPAVTHGVDVKAAAGAAKPPSSTASN